MQIDPNLHGWTFVDDLTVTDGPQPAPVVAVSATYPTATGDPGVFTAELFGVPLPGEHATAEDAFSAAEDAAGALVYRVAPLVWEDEDEVRIIARTFSDLYTVEQIGDECRWHHDDFDTHEEWRPCLTVEQGMQLAALDWHARIRAALVPAED